MKNLMDSTETLRSSAAPIAKTIMLRAGVYGALRGLKPNPRLAILRYHAICGSEGYRYASPGICVSPAGFERHVAYLKAHYTVVSLPEALRTLRNGEDLPSNAVAITFDDGYADNLAAARTLHRYGATGTFYLTSGCLEGEQPFWPSEVRALVARISSPVIVLNVSGQEVRIAVPSTSNRDQTILQLNRLLKSHPIPTRESIRQQLRSLAGVGGVRSPMLTWKQAAEMRDLGMTIGAHTVTHPNLPSAGLEAATQEIVGSKSRLERELGIPVTMFSYPNGGAERYYTRELQLVVAQAGFEAATTSREGFAGPASDFFALQRVQVSERLEDLVFRLEVDRVMATSSR